MTEPSSDAREALLDDLAERALNAVQPEIDRLRANLTTVFHQLKAAERSHRATLAGCCVMLSIPEDTAEPDVFEAIRKLTAEVAAKDCMCACNADEKWMHNTTCPRGILAWDGTDWQTNGYYADADGFVWYLCSVLPTGEPLFTPMAGDMDVSMPLSDVLAEGGPLTPCPRPTPPV